MDQNSIKKLIFNKLHICLSADTAAFNDNEEFLDKTAKAIEAGIHILHYNPIGLRDSEALSIGKTLRQLCAFYDTLFIVQSRVDFALALNANGVYLKENDIDIKTARKIIGYDKLIGFLAKSPKEAFDAFKNEADYLGAFLSLSDKTDKYSGFNYIEWLISNLPMDFFVFNNINSKTIKTLCDYGIRKILIDGAFLKHKNSIEKINKYKGLLYENNY